MTTLIAHGVNYVKRVKKEEKLEDIIIQENGRNIRKIFKTPSYLKTSLGEEGEVELVEMSLQPSCFIEIFLEVPSEEQRRSNMKEIEFLLIETDKYLDFYGIIAVCYDRSMQTDLF